MNYIKIKNNQSIPLDSIPVLDYIDFKNINISYLSTKNSVSNTHCLNYFGFRHKDKLKLICCIANDEEHNIYLNSCEINVAEPIDSFTAINPAFHNFEREITENFAVKYTDHPWLKPLRFAHNRADKAQTIANYPFYKIEGEELHEVGVGPIHAGIIEPGHFRFICNGEQIMHLEIQLGFQHRGIENLMLQKKKLIEKITLAEFIAGDTVVGHTVAFARLWESLTGFSADKELQLARTIALELERIAIHTGDLSALCTDIAYQLGSSVLGRLRTPILNFFQCWCGNRLAKGLVRPAYNKYPLSRELADELLRILDNYEPDFEEMLKVIITLPSALDRFEKTGIVTKEQATEIGTVGMAARMCGIARDIRYSHPDDIYLQLNHKPILKRHGDVYSRLQIRREEIRQSIKYIREMLKDITQTSIQHSTSNIQHSTFNIQHSTFTISLVEGWRGEICHCAITDENGELIIYKIKDPSFHNWLALALSVRNNEISDFPVCNKSFNLSYCGNDL
ncbi:MAG: NADH dehydrogenase subunit [Bacteroidales bacterium]|nr:NADH dehydrogenase subunit [Bacteroidales bacterium]